MSEPTSSTNKTWSSSTSETIDEPCGESSTKFTVIDAVAASDS